MANAKKCDRCGGYYQEVEMNVLERLGLILKEAAEVFDVKVMTRNKILKSFEEMWDLCPDCSKSLKKWMNGKEKDNGNTL